MPAYKLLILGFFDFGICGNAVIAKFQNHCCPD